MARCNKSQKDDAVLDHTLVHMFWIGATLPEWAPACVQSYLDTGHRVYWWLYLVERSADLPALRASGLLQQRRLCVRDAEDILPYSSARTFYYHGMGDDCKWSGWAPFSDWFRCVVIERYGGWWVDADGVSVRPLNTLADETQVETMIFCTERHRFDRRTIGAVAVEPPHVVAEEHLSLRLPPSTGLAELRTWAEKVQESSLEVCLVTNSHFYIPVRGSELMRTLARDMYALLERYAHEVETRGVDSVKSLSRGGRARCALPTGTIGMVLFQKAVRELLCAEGEPSKRSRILHWSVFNPVEATDASRMHSVLTGQEELFGKWVRTIHIFRQVRDDWKRMGLSIPLKFSPRTNDANPEGDYKRTKKRLACERPMQIVEVEAGGPLLKRRKPRLDKAGETSELEPLKRLAFDIDWLSSVLEGEPEAEEERNIIRQNAQIFF